MKRIILTILFAQAALGFLGAQVKITWDQLGDVTLESRYFEKFDQRFLTPVFGKTPKSLEGKTVVIKGYVLPLDGAGKLYALSRYPFSACFFCGGAGPETVIELDFSPHSKKKRFEMDDVFSFKGILKLNNTDPEHFNYILKNAEWVK